LTDSEVICGCSKTTDFSLTATVLGSESSNLKLDGEVNLDGLGNHPIGVVMLRCSKAGERLFRPPTNHPLSISSLTACSASSGESHSMSNDRIRSKSRSVIFSIPLKHRAITRRMSSSVSSAIRTNIKAIHLNLIVGILTINQHIHVMVLLARVVGGNNMSKDYIARDPRTGKPLNVGKSRRKKQYIESREGPWLAIQDADIIPLANGDIADYNVSWRSKTFNLQREDGIIGLTRLKGNRAIAAHESLLKGLEDEKPSIRVAALKALPEVATQKSDELFDWLSVLLDDDDLAVRQAASEALSISAPVFPSGVDIMIHNELRSYDANRSKHAFKGLEQLCEAWPEVACDHIDELFLETDANLRLRGAKLLGKVLLKSGHIGWDLVSWALNDDNAPVRRAAAKTLPKLAKADTRIATILSERALSDSDSQVRISAVKAIRSLDKDSGRARELILKGASSKDVEVRRACIEMLPILYGEDVLRGIAIDLLKTETDDRLIKSLTDFASDDSLEGTEAQKNRFLAPAPAIPKLDREVAEAAGKSVGLEPIKPKTVEDTAKSQETQQPKQPAKVTGLYRSVSQDDMMGYHDDDY